MSVQLLALHGYTSHGGALRSSLTPLARGWQGWPEPEYPDAPHACSPESVARVYPANTRPPPGPYLTWCRADDQGRVYEGWAETLALLRARMTDAACRGHRIGLIGFSQGAMVAATLCALAARGELPQVAFAVLIAGSVPRALALAPLFDEPIAVPSLHVWGLRDKVTGTYSPVLAEHFAEDPREVLTWRGPHLIPTHGPTGASIIEYLIRQG